MAKKTATKLNKKQISLVFIVVGIGLIAWGMQRYGTFGDELSRSLGTESSGYTMLFLIAGAALTALGVFQLFRK